MKDSSSGGVAVVHNNSTKSVAGDDAGTGTIPGPRVQHQHHVPLTTEKDKNDKKWNTKNLPARILVDVTSAACAAISIAPIIVTIDRGIMENASGKASLKDSVLKSIQIFLTRPHKFIFSKPFALIFTVYGSTYMTANTIDTISSTVHARKASHTTHGTAKFIGTSAANLSIGIWKDSHLAKLFSTTAPRPMPAPSIALFAIRDSLTIAASFNVPPLLAPHIPMQYLPSFMQSVNRQSIAQFIAPAAVQIASTPVHLLGLDLYNTKKATMQERWEVVRKNWMPSFAARVCRIVPAFGVAGVANTRLRQEMMSRLE